MAALISTKKTYLDPAHLPPVQGHTLQRILAWLRPYRSMAFLVLGCLAVSAGLGLLPPLLVKAVVDRAIPRGDVRQLLLLCGAMAVVAVLTGLVSVAQKRLTTLLSE